MRNRTSFLRTLLLLIVGVALSGAAASTAWAQFGGLGKIKLPKKLDKIIPKTKETGPSQKDTPETGASASGSLEISMMAPDVAPPGGSLNVVLTGKALSEGMSLNFSCVGSQFSPASVKVENPTRAVARVNVPLGAQDGPCGINVKYLQTKELFRIASSSDIPVVLASVMYLGEGEMNLMDAMMKMGQAATKQMQQSNWQEKGGEEAPPQGLMLAPDTVKFMDQGQLVFEKPISSVKGIGEMMMNGKPAGLFRIVFTDGKIYNFGASGQGSDESGTVKFIRRKLGK
jgi:hypothetical protein